MLTKKYQNILFDLDGTLIDSYLGISNGINHLIQQWNLEKLEENTIKTFIGPPLDDSFIKYFSTINTENVEQALKVFREYYRNKGIFECSLYPNVTECLHTLKNNQKTIFLATAKPRIFAEKILEYFKIKEFFSGIYGVELDGSIKNKYEVIHYAHQNSQLNKNSSIMIGDKEDDIIACKKFGIDVIAARYGYGEDSEFNQADYIINDIKDILTTIL